MKIARLQLPDGRIKQAAVEGDFARLLAGIFPTDWSVSPERVSLKEARLLAPIVPAALMCFGRNYKAHAAEGGSDIPKAPLLFIKATSCLAGPGDPIRVPAAAPGQVDYEAELAVVIGKPARNVAPADALKYVAGYTCANDVSARDAQTADGQWARAKSFDTFGPLGPWIETEFDPSDKQVIGRLNGQVMQQASTKLMIFDVAYLISYLSRGMTLLAGSVLLTGTPAGCGFAQKPPRWLVPGDVYEVEIEGIGVLRNPVAKE